MGTHISGLKASELPNEDLKFLEDVIGLEAVQKLLLHAPGMSFYVPSRLPAEFVRKYVLMNFDESDRDRSARRIALTLRISKRHVWRILAEEPGPRRRAAG
jgi:hypothetical protein